MKITHNSKKGFTLIELLIVVAIIGVLSTLLMANFIGVRQRARDAQRKSDVRQIQAALEIYRSDIGSYPAPALDICTHSLTGTVNASTVTYMKSIPCDPSGINNGNYYYSSDGSSYVLGACLENTADSQGTTTAPTGATGCTSNPATYFVANNP